MASKPEREFRIVETSNPDYNGPKWGYRVLTIISIYAIINVSSQLTLIHSYSHEYASILTGIILTLFVLFILIKFTKNMFREEYLQYRFYLFVFLYFGLYGSTMYNHYQNNPETLWEYKLMAGSSGIALIYIFGNLIYSYFVFRVKKNRFRKINKIYCEIKDKAVKAFESESWVEAISHYKYAANYLTSFNNPIFGTNILNCRYNMAIAHFNNSNFEDSLSILQEIREAFPLYMPDEIENDINEIKGIIENSG